MGRICHGCGNKISLFAAAWELSGRFEFCDECNDKVLALIGQISNIKSIDQWKADKKELPDKFRASVTDEEVVDAIERKLEKRFNESVFGHEVAEKLRKN